MLKRLLMVVDLTAANVNGAAIISDTKAVIATNQKRVFVFGGAMNKNLEDLAHKTNKAFVCEVSGNTPY